MVATLAWEGKALAVPEGMQITKMIKEAFKNMLLRETSYNYDNFMLVSM